MTDSSEARVDEVRQFLADVENRWPSGREVVRLKSECGFLLAEVVRLRKENQRLTHEAEGLHAMIQQTISGTGESSAEALAREGEMRG